MDRTALSLTKASEVSLGFSRPESRYFKRVTGNLGGLFVRPEDRTRGIMRKILFPLRRTLQEGWPE